LEKMKVALHFGADAVYFGLPDFSLRARSNQFTKEDIIEAQKICRKMNRKFYLTMNIYAHNVHLNKIKEQLKWLEQNGIRPNGIIASDPGIIRLIKKYLPQTDIHLSTQANATNIEAVKFWQEVGITRVVLARETVLNEIKEIHQAVPTMELESFVHGAMCMSYSGRCILSKWMTGRSANLGDCAQPCRWRWSDNKDENFQDNTQEGKELELVDDQKRFGMKVEEDRHGTYMFNSYDLSLLEHLDKLIKAGVVSFKIEGRAKSVYYLAVTVRAYRRVLDALLADNKNNKKDVDKIISEEKKELRKLSHRGYWTGFVLGDEPPHLLDKAYLPVEWEFVGISTEIDLIDDCDTIREETQCSKNVNKNNRAREVFVHNKLAVGDEVEVITVGENFITKIEQIKDEEGRSVLSAHGGLGKKFAVIFNQQIPKTFILRKKKCN